MSLKYKHQKGGLIDENLTVPATLIGLMLSIQMGFAAPLTCTLNDQQSVSITIYHSNVGLVLDFGINFTPLPPSETVSQLVFCMTVFVILPIATQSLCGRVFTGH
ncbi:MAG: hypothetical protein ACUVWO_05240 [Thermodesulfobacteriota bacterium]